MTIITAKVAKVPFGNIEIDGLLFPDGSFGVAIPQLADLSLVQPNRSIKVLESLLGIALSSNQKAKTELNSKAVNTISLQDFEKLLVRLDRKFHHPLAQELRDQLVGLSITQLFSDAFNIKFEKEERQEWLKKRQATIESFWWFGDNVKLWLDGYNVHPRDRGYFFQESFKELSLGLFGKLPCVINEELGLGKNALNRDHFGNTSLRRIDAIQRLAAAYLTREMLPHDAIKKALAQYNDPIIDYRK